MLAGGSWGSGDGRSLTLMVSVMAGFCLCMVCVFVWSLTLMVRVFINVNGWGFCLKCCLVKQSFFVSSKISFNRG
jgi:hypothetical protein